MKISEFFINRYGPLTYSSPVQLDRFTLFFGKNETGKTLTIDALVKLMLGKNVKVFKKIERVEERPYGYALINHENKVLKLPEMGNLVTLLNLRPSDFANVFFIRNSDLVITNESSFYKNITDRLTGLRSNEVKHIKENIQKIAKLTPGFEFRDIGEEKLKTRMKEARRLVQKIESTIKKFKEDSYDHFIEQKVELEEKLKKIKEEIDIMETVRKREIYEKAMGALYLIDDARVKLTQLSRFDESTREFWRDTERDNARLKNERDRLVKQYKNQMKRVTKLKEMFQKEEKSFSLLRAKKGVIDSEIRQRITSYQKRYQRLCQYTARQRPIAPLMWSGFAVSILMIFMYMAKDIPIFLIFSLLFLGIGVMALVFTLQYVWNRGYQAREFSRLNAELAKYSLSGKNIEEIIEKLQRFDDDINQKEGALKELQMNYEMEERQAASTEKNIQECDVQIETWVNTIKGLKEKSGENSLATYEKKLYERQDYENKITQAVQLLKSLFGEKESDDLSLNMEFWKQKIGDLEAFAGLFPEQQFDEKKLSQLREELRTVENEVVGVSEKIHNHEKVCEDIEREANSILQLSDDYLNCTTTRDLAYIIEKLNSFIEENETLKEDAKIAWSIFDDLEKEKEQRISELFGKESVISRFFHKITNGRYREAIYSSDLGKVIVIDRKGKVIEVDKLSAGAYDQLYLSIRIAFGQKLLNNQPGFFIMDDPFIRSDSERLTQQLGLLKEIVKMGWQILYFSAKDEIRTALSKDIDKKSVTFIELPGVE